MIKKTEKTFLNYKGYEEYLLHFMRERRAGRGDMQYIFKFPNGYGASVIKAFGSYGYEQDFWEVAMIKFNDAGVWELVGSNEIMDDVEGYCPDSRVRILLGYIKEY